MALDKREQVSKNSIGDLDNDTFLPFVLEAVYRRCKATLRYFANSTFTSAAV